MNNMKAAMILFDSELREEVFMLMKISEIVNYTLMPNLFGSGNQGKKEGSVAWPGKNEILMLVISESEFAAIKNNLMLFKKEKTGAEGILFFAWELSEVVL